MTRVSRSAKRVLLVMTGALGCAFPVVSAQSGHPPTISWHIQPTSGDSGFVQSIMAFQQNWGAAWRRSEGLRHNLDDNWGVYDPQFYTPRPTDRYILLEGGRRRRINVPYNNSKCAGAGYPPILGTDSLRPELRHRWMTSTYRRFSVCPSWYSGMVELTGDERLSLDHALVPAERAGVVAQRAELLTILDAALSGADASPFARGQFVRFAVDQGALARADAAVAACAAIDWWCGFLQGYVRAHVGDLAGAAAAFSSAAARAPAFVRCRLEAVDDLIDPSGAGRTRPPDCSAAAMPLSEWVWTLADPLWSEPGNARRVEHYVRHAQVILRGSLPRDERHNWNERDGNDVRRAMILRYGWPTYMWWNGPKTDSTMAEVHGRQTIPRSTYEYTPGRLHLMPPASALADPFAWQSAAQPVMAPPGHDSPDVNAPLWFPVEHMALPYALVQQPPGQTALLRRQTDLLVGVAVTLDATLLRRGPDAVVRDVQLWAAQTPDAPQRLADADGRTGQDLVLLSALPAAPTVLSLERAAQGPWPALRVRYGLRPPAPLAALAPGATAVSAPVLVHVAPDAPTLPSDPARILRQMRGTLALPRGERLGVYWETYGLAPTDTVTHAVWLQRVTTPGRLARVGQALGLGRGRNTPVAIEWTETRLGPTATDLGGPVRIIGRTLVLDVGALPAGDYALTVEARRPGQAPVRESQTLRVE